MNKQKLAKHWWVVEVQLRQASKFLNEPERFSIAKKELQDYECYIDNNEFELALDELASIAIEFGCKSGFWRRLKKPAIQMGLNDKADEYEKYFHDALLKNT